MLNKNSEGANKGNKNSWMTGEVFKRLDIFGLELPKFILKGKDKVQTRIGGVFSILIFILVLAYASLKF